ncbi:amidohydrolase family protein [soil metagenome]
MPITDAHMHVGDFPMFGVNLDESGLAGYLVDNGIDAGMVFHQDNAMVQRVIQDIPAAHGLYWANPKTPGTVDELRDFLDDPKFHGVKLHPLMDGFHPNDPIVWPIIELLIERDMPALIHCGHPIFSLPWSIEELIVQFPEAKIILGHMGHGNVVYIDASIKVAERNPNVWLETSGMPMSIKILEAVNKIGSNRVLYGSDGPWHEPRVEQLKVQLAGLQPDDLENVMHKSSQRLFLGADI